MFQVMVRQQTPTYSYDKEFAMLWGESCHAYSAFEIYRHRQQFTICLSAHMSNHLPAGAEQCEVLMAKSYRHLAQTIASHLDVVVGVRVMVRNREVATDNNVDPRDTAPCKGMHYLGCKGTNRGQLQACTTVVGGGAGAAVDNEMLDVGKAPCSLGFHGCKITVQTICKRRYERRVVELGSG